MKCIESRIVPKLTTSQINTFFGQIFLSYRGSRYQVVKTIRNKRYPLIVWRKVISDFQIGNEDALWLFWLKITHLAIPLQNDRQPVWTFFPVFEPSPINQ